MLSPRKQAIVDNAKTYHGKPCKNNHTEKHTRNSTCVQCVKEYQHLYMIEYRENNKDKYKAYQKEYQKQYYNKKKDNV